MTTSLAEQQERARINQLLASDQANDEHVEGVYLDALKLIKNNLQAFYVRYANEQGLTVTEVKRDVTNWDLSQFVDAIDELLEDGDKSDDELSKRLKLFQYQAAKGNRQDLIAAMIGATIAISTKHAHKASRQHLANDYANEQQWQSNVLKRLSGHYEWTLPKQHDVEIEPNIEKVIDGSQWSDTLWNHSDAMVTDVQNVVRDALNNGMSQDNLNQLIKHLRHADKERGNLESAARNRMWQIERLVRSESARVVDEATMNQLKKDNVHLVAIVTEPDACKKCRDLAEIGPFSLEECPRFPTDTHPNCRCGKIPFKTNSNLATLPESSVNSLNKFETTEREINYYETDGEVNWDEVNSNAFRKKFDKLELDSNKRDRLVKVAREILSRREGSKYESIALMNKRTGDIEIWNSDVKPKMIDFETGRLVSSYLKQRHDDDFVMLHNHPDGTPPSAGDINTLSSGQRKGVTEALAIGHNGEVYLYTGSNSKLPGGNPINKFAEAMQKLGYSIDIATTLAYTRLGKKYGFTVRRL